MSDRIVVGISGNPSGYAALDWALEYARPRRFPVELVHVIDDKWIFVPANVGGEGLLRAEHDLRLRAERAIEEAPELLVHPSVLEGSPIDELVDRASTATLLVIGTHPLGRFGNLVYSTRAAHIAARAICSVVVVPEQRKVTGNAIVVGVDGSPPSVAALEFGAEEADRLGLPLRAIYAWRTTSAWATDLDEAPSMEPTDADRLILSEALAGLAEKYPDLTIDHELSPAAPVDALVDAGTEAHLLVVGTHGRHGVVKRWLGSVSHELVLAMPCPVAIIRPAAAPAD